MDSVHNVGSLSYVSQPVSIREFLESWQSALADEPIVLKRLPKTNVKQIAGIMNVSRSTVQELDTVCGIDTLKCPGQVKVRDDATSTIPDDTELVTLRLRKSELEKRANSKTYTHRLYATFRNHRSVMRTRVPGDKLIPMTVRDVVISVQIYRPFVGEQSCKYKPLVLDQELRVLGQQKLTDLRDAITCVADIALPVEMSVNPDMPVNTRCKDIYPSGFFYINGTFFNDLRHPEAKDLSSVIRTWGATRPNQIGEMREAAMEDTQFLDLSLRVGLPYLYVHQGDCEHLIVFTDIRMMNIEDSSDVSKYPIVSSNVSKKRTVCIVCLLYNARWVTYDDCLCSQSPAFFCDACFRELHYDSSGTKLGPFTAYRFYDKNAVLP
ncbi:PREDICTED: snRNA-activating protein complex subunit 3-like [Priapulus caudatus]|uniref:snRNA-activating protein complex subunit 3 n=1 Tax=Priapulus caudatus TaxID=37621 RepID=A0ABM1DP83_PRICU|nr:PREDICTED: snRNA-activating protein complex subunit 3-like [Priapulus caudatus]